MTRMVEGDKWELYVIPELAYGGRGSGKLIGPHATLVFTIHMIQIKGDSLPAKRDEKSVTDGAYGDAPEEQSESCSSGL